MTPVLIVCDVSAQVVAAALTAVSWIPQLVAVLRAPDRTGVSPGAWLIGVVLSTLWSIWSWQTGEWGFLVSEAAFAAGSVTILVLLSGWRRSLAGIVGGGLLAAGAVTAMPVSWFAVGGLVMAAAIRLSQLGRILRTRSAAGVSSSVWLLLIAANTLWAVVGMISHQPALLWAWLVTVLSSLLVWTAIRVQAPGP